MLFVNSNACEQTAAKICVRCPHNKPRYICDFRYPAKNCHRGLRKSKRKQCSPNGLREYGKRSRLTILLLPSVVFKVTDLRGNKSGNTSLAAHHTKFPRGYVQYHQPAELSRMQYLISTGHFELLRRNPHHHRGWRAWTWIVRYFMRDAPYFRDHADGVHQPWYRPTNPPLQI